MIFPVISGFSSVCHSYCPPSYTAVLSYTIISLPSYLYMSKQLPLDHPFQQYTVNLCTIQCSWLTVVINKNSLYPPTYWSFNYLSWIFLVSLYAKSLDCKREACNSTLDPRLFFTACPTGQDRQIASVEDGSSIWLHKNSSTEYSGEVFLEYFLHLGLTESEQIWNEEPNSYDNYQFSFSGET